MASQIPVGRLTNRGTEALRMNWAILGVRIRTIRGLTAPSAFTNQGLSFLTGLHKLAFGLGLPLHF